MISGVTLSGDVQPNIAGKPYAGIVGVGINSVLVPNEAVSGPDATPNPDLMNDLVPPTVVAPTDDPSTTVATILGTVPIPDDTRANPEPAVIDYNGTPVTVGETAGGGVPQGSYDLGGGTTLTIGPDGNISVVTGDTTTPTSTSLTGDPVEDALLAALSSGGLGSSATGSPTDTAYSTPGTTATTSNSGETAVILLVLVGVVVGGYFLWKHFQGKIAKHENPGQS
jgi:hypothetical protein